MKVLNIIPILLFAAGCLPDPRPKVHESGYITSPDFPVPTQPENPLTLVNNSTMEMGGSFLLLNPNAEPQLLADIIEASESSRMAWAEWMAFANATKYKEIGLLKLLDNKVKELEADRDDYRKNEAPTKPKSLEQKFEGAALWFPNILPKLENIDLSKAEELFVHYSQLQMEGYRTLHEGDTVEFEITQGQKGPQASSVTVITQE